MAKWELKWSEKPPAKGKKAAAAAFQKTCQELDPKFDDAFNAKVWDWSSGEPRDIVDTGALRDSKTGPNFTKGYGKSGQTVKWDWTESYASYVYVGGRKGGRTMPGRPWADAVLGIKPTSGIEVFNFDESFQLNLNKELS